MVMELKDRSEKDKVKVLRRVAEDLEKPIRARREVNLSRINKYTKDGETVVVPGKVLGGGEIEHKITISAYKFSQYAIVKLKKS